jgi:hypothetical protein
LREIRKILEKGNNEVVVESVPALPTHTPVFGVPGENENNTSASLSKHAASIAAILNETLSQPAKSQLESLVPGAAQFNIEQYRPTRGECYDALTGEHRGTVFSTSIGILAEPHVAKQCWNKKGYVKFADKQFELPGILKGPFKGMNNELVFLKRIDGLAVLSKKHFAIPEIGQKVALWTKTGLNTGTIDSFDNGPDGPQVRADYTSENFDCGSPVLNVNSKIVGIHFARGEIKKNNLFIGVTEQFLALWDNQPKLKN